jgi:outer membrane protein TolC
VKLKILSLSFYILIAQSLLGQEDSEKFFGFNDFMELVRNNHPLAMQAGLQEARGDAELMKSRGAFDPKLGFEHTNKDFKGTEYYNLSDAGLKVPTWFGVEVMGGYERNRGQYVDPENNTPDAGLWYAGLSVPLGKGLFIDQRRAELRKAKIYRESTLAMRQQMLNELLYDASYAYWNWYQAVEITRVYENALDVARERFEAVKKEAMLGDKPIIDTLEAGIQVQSRWLNLKGWQLELANSINELQMYLWADGWIPLELDSNFLPKREVPLDEENNFNMYLTNLDSLLEAHPELRISQYKIDSYEVDQRMKREQLKPQVDLKYNVLAPNSDESSIPSFNSNNYAWGVEFGMPIFLRKERAGLKLNQVKIQESEMGLKSKQNSLRNKVLQSINLYNISNDQIELYSRTVNDYLGLLNGEQTKFEGGESSLFLVNRRELGYINAEVKLIELKAKNRLSVVKTKAMLGILAD